MTSSVDDDGNIVSGDCVRPKIGALRNRAGRLALFELGDARVMVGKHEVVITKFRIEFRVQVA